MDRYLTAVSNMELRVALTYKSARHIPAACILHSKLSLRVRCTGRCALRCRWINLLQPTG